MGAYARRVSRLYSWLHRVIASRGSQTAIPREAVMQGLLKQELPWRSPLGSAKLVVETDTPSALPSTVAFSWR